MTKAPSVHISWWKNGINKLTQQTASFVTGALEVTNPTPEKNGPWWPKHPLEDPPLPSTTSLWIKFDMDFTGDKLHPDHSNSPTDILQPANA